MDGGNALTPVNERRHLVRYRLIIKVKAAFRQARPHPFGGVRHESHRFDSLFDYSLCDVDKCTPGHKYVVPHPGAKRQLAGKLAAHIRHLGANDAQDPQIRDGDLHLRPKHHCAQIIHQRFRIHRGDVQVKRILYLGHIQVVQDPALTIQVQGTGAEPVGNIVEFLGKQIMQKRGGIRARYPNDRAMRTVHQRARGTMPLFGERIPIMPSHPHMGGVLVGVAGRGRPRHCFQ